MAQIQNRPGSLRPPANANAVVQKNVTATAMQSPKIIPFMNYFKSGRANTTAPQVQQNWLTRR